MTAGVGRRGAPRYVSKMAQQTRRLIWSRSRVRAATAGPTSGSGTTSPGSTRGGARTSLRELKKLRTAWPELKVRPVFGGLVIEPSMTRVRTHCNFHRNPVKTGCLPRIKGWELPGPNRREQRRRPRSQATLAAKPPPEGGSGVEPPRNERPRTHRRVGIRNRSLMLAIVLGNDGRAGDGRPREPGRSSGTTPPSPRATEASADTCADGKSGALSRRGRQGGRRREDDRVIGVLRRLLAQVWPGPR